MPTTEKPTPFHFPELETIDDEIQLPATEAAASAAMLELLEVENVIAMSHETETHVAFIAQVMLGTDFAFDAKTDGHGAMTLDRADAHFLKNLGVIEAVQNRVIELAERNLCDRHSDGRYFRIDLPAEIRFGTPGVDELTVRHDPDDSDYWQIEIPAVSVVLVPKLAEVLLDLRSIRTWSTAHVAAFLRRHGFVDLTPRI